MFECKEIESPTSSWNLIIQAASLRVGGSMIMKGLYGNNITGSSDFTITGKGLKRQRLQREDETFHSLSVLQERLKLGVGAFLTPLLHPPSNPNPKTW